MCEVTQTAICAHCGKEISPQHTGLCPACGKEGKNINVSIKDSIQVHSSIKWETRKEYYQKHKGVVSTVIAITVISPFIGLFLAGPAGVFGGLVLGVVAYFLGPKAATKIINITKGRA